MGIADDRGCRACCPALLPLLPLLPLLCACATCRPASARGEAGRSSPGSVATTAPAPSPPSLEAVALEDPSGRALDRFYSRLLQLQRTRRGRVRITHYGDSHVVPDALTGKVRDLLQEQFGDAGGGLVLVGRPWRSYRHGAARLGASGVWRAERIWSRYDRRRRRPRDDLFGLAGISVHSRWRGQAWIRPRQGQLAAIDVHYLRQPRGGRIDVRVGDKVVRRIFTVASRKQPGYALVELPPRTRRVELHTSAGEVRIFGVDLVRADRGLVYDALGINGARADTLLQWNEVLMTDQLRRAAPDLVVLAYGSNEIDADTLTRDGFASSFDEVLVRMRRMVPAADCLVVGPPSQARHSKEEGWVLPARLDFVIAEQRRLAARHGCAFWDQRAAMGGPQAVLHWVVSDPPFASQDRIHLRWGGYLAVGQALHRALMSGFEAYRVRLAAQPEDPSSRPGPARVPGNADHVDHVDHVDHGRIP